MIKASTNTDGTQVFIVDDEQSVRDSLSSLLRSVGLVVKACSSTAEFLSFDMPKNPCCLILDVRLQCASGLDFQRQLADQGIMVPIIMITGFGDIAMSVRAMKAGAVDFLAKPFRDQDLLDAVMTALDKDQNRRSSELESVDVQQRFDTLTPREQEVMQLAVSGLMNKQIAGELSLSLITVKVHRGNAMKKMKAKTFAELVRMSESLKKSAE
ncbi:response regulator transcription factor [Gallaecimonas pentaromativorans]|uniref:response regulator transcription factor n=1 Tax=Gallaecimonas pentaromativorans TaxID=584787 RepID=UPI003A91B630